MIDLLNLNETYDFIVGFNHKGEENKTQITNQDKLHVRILGILQIAKSGNIEVVLNRNFTEKFIFDDEKQVIYYCIKLQRRKEGKKYADC